MHVKSLHFSQWIDMFGSDLLLGTLNSLISRTSIKITVYSLAQIGFLSVFVYQAFFMYGMKYTVESDASRSLSTLFTAILAVHFWVKIDKKTSIEFTGFHWCCSSYCILQMWIFQKKRITRDALIGLSAYHGGATILMKKIMTRDDAMFLFNSVWACVVGLIIQTPAALVETPIGIDSVSATAWFWLGFLAIFSTVLSYVWFADGVRIIGAARASFYVYPVPIFVLCGWMIRKIRDFIIDFFHTNRRRSLSCSSQASSSTLMFRYTCESVQLPDWCRNNGSRYCTSVCARG